jgi:hypothetical protein
MKIFSLVTFIFFYSSLSQAQIPNCEKALEIMNQVRVENIEDKAQVYQFQQISWEALQICMQENLGEDQEAFAQVVQEANACPMGAKKITIKPSGEIILSDEDALAMLALSQCTADLAEDVGNNEY